jgi:hypothetical protein
LRGLDELENIDADFAAARANTDPVAQATLAEIIGRHGLDVSAIEAEAFRKCLPVWSAIDQLLTSH